MAPLNTLAIALGVTAAIIIGASEALISIRLEGLALRVARR
jgi:hypothetical protein